MQIIFFKFTNFFPSSPFIKASLIFHSSGTFQSNTFFPELADKIFKFLNFPLIKFRVFKLPSPVKDLFIGHRDFAQDNILFEYLFNNSSSYI